MSEALTFEKLCELEPELLTLLGTITPLARESGFCANAVWYGYGDTEYPKKWLERLVGHDRPKHRDDDPITQAILRSSEAYDIAYDKLYDALPDCNHEGVMCGWHESAEVSR